MIPHKVSLDDLLALPELTDIIAAHLPLGTREVLVQTCRAWKFIWTPYLYETIRFGELKCPSLCESMLYTYGHHVKSINLWSFRQLNPSPRLFSAVPNLTSLVLQSPPRLKQEFQISLEAVPRLKSLTFTSAEHCTSFSVVASLAGLECLKWNYARSFTSEVSDGQLLIAEILHVLKSCRRLKQLHLENTIVVDQESPDTGDTRGQEDNKDDSWENSTLVEMSLRNTSFQHGRHQDQTEHSALLSGVMERIPNLFTLMLDQHTGSGIRDWIHLLEHTPHLGQLTLILPENSYHQPLLLKAILQSHSKLETLKIHPGENYPQELLHEIMMKNPRLQIISVNKSSVFEDNTLLSLCGMPKSLSTLPNPTPSFPSSQKSIQPILTYTLRSLNLNACASVTCHGARAILETCAGLESLDLCRTSANSIELFEGERPWACQKTLYKLSMDLRPRTQNYAPYNAWWDLHSYSSNPPYYSTEEEATIRSRLYACKALQQLTLTGRAVTISLFESEPLPPRLQFIELLFPLPALTGQTKLYMDEYQSSRAPSTSSVQSTKSAIRKEAVIERINDVFSDWEQLKVLTWKSTKHHKMLASVKGTRW